MTGHKEDFVKWEKEELLTKQRRKQKYTCIEQRMFCVQKKYHLCVGEVVEEAFC